jgi:hypothetical protein
MPESSEYCVEKQAAKAERLGRVSLTRHHQSRVKKEVTPDVVAMPVIPALGRLRQEDREVKVTMSYTVRWTDKGGRKDGRHETQKKKKKKRKK